MEEVFFIDYGTNNSNKNWKQLINLAPHAKKIAWDKQDLFSIFKKLSKISYSKKFWVIDGRTKIFPNFKFRYTMPDWDTKYVYTWKIFSNIHLVPGGVYYLTRDFTDFKHIKRIAGHLTDNDFDIFFISYNEEYADQNFEILFSRFPTVKRINGVKGIHNAHIEAAKQALGDMFWVVDADAIISEDFNFNFRPKPWDMDQVHVWRSKNPVNNLTYGYGGVKLLPTMLTLNMNKETVDMTTSISKKFRPMKQISNISMFNTDEWSTWRSAFRECVKLSSKVIDGEVNAETSKRLNAWCSKGFDAPYGKWAISGALAGRKYGTENSGNNEAISKINDFDWLYSEFLKTSKQNV